MWYWKENTEVPPENLGKKKKNELDVIVIWMEEGVPAQQWRWQLQALRMESVVPTPPALFPPPPSLHAI